MHAAICRPLQSTLCGGAGGTRNGARLHIFFGSSAHFVYTGALFPGGILAYCFSWLRICLSGCALTAVIFFSALASAQSEQSKIEAGAQYSNLTMNRFASTPSEPGLGGRFSWNLTPLLAIETEFNFYPSSYTPQSVQDGGRVVSWLTGIKVPAIRREKYAIFGKAGAGLVSFTNVPVQTSATTVENRVVTHFATDIGAVFEYYISPRWILRTDAGLDLLQIHSRTLSLGAGSITAPGTLRPAFQFTTGFSYRLGDLQPREEQETVSDIGQKWEVAAVFATQSRQSDATSDVVTQPGLGARVTYDLFPFLSLEAATTVFVRSESRITLLEGGRSIQNVFGVKSGFRYEKLGYFLRLRPGVQTFTSTVSSFDPTTLAITTGSNTHPVLDLGGGIELYPSKRTVLRFDAGDTLLFLGSTSIPFGTQTASDSAGTKNTFQFSTSFGWRF